MSENIFTTFDKLVPREEKETLLGQKGKVYWIVGQSGSGKTTLATALERKWTDEGKYVIVLDGDNLRSGLNAGLGFSDEERTENIRRAAQVAKILVDNGAIVLACFVCPKASMRAIARDILRQDMIEVYIKVSIEELIKRDTKGFYKKAIEGKMEHLTGINAEFEEPKQADIVINTENVSIEECIRKF